MSGEPYVTLCRESEMDYGDPRLPERFWAKVYPEPNTGCWFWGGAVHSGLPYGMWTVSRRPHRAHVSSFKANGGQLTSERPFVLHSCDQPPCVRPLHLRAGSAAENIDDARRRKRLAVGTNSSLTVADVESLRRRYAEGERVVELAALFGTSPAAISLLVRGLRWTAADGPITEARPRVGHPSPIATREQCSYGHDMTPENTRLKPKKDCRSGFERVCRTCARRRSTENNDRRRGVAAKRSAA